MAFLPTKPLHLGYGHPLDAHLSQSVADIVKLKGLNDRGNQFHVVLLRKGPITALCVVKAGRNCIIAKIGLCDIPLHFRTA